MSIAAKLATALIGLTEIGTIPQLRVPHDDCDVEGGAVGREIASRSPVPLSKTVAAIPLRLPGRDPKRILHCQDYAWQFLCFKGSLFVPSVFGRWLYSRL